MTFLSPLTLIGLLLIALPVAIHLLVRRRARRLDFPSLAFLRETPSFKLRPRRIRQPLLLALRAAAIILLVMGFARPLLLLRRQMTAPVHFILMDASLSMQTRGRTDAAREQARAIVNKLRGNERAGVIAFSSEAKTLAPLSSDRAQLLAAIERYQPTGGAPDYDTAFTEIKTQLRREPQTTGEISIISDFQESALEMQRNIIASRAAPLPVATYLVGAEVERNAFLLDEDARRTERGVELSATEIISDGKGRSGERHSWTLDANVGARPGIEWRTQANGQITGSLSALEPDDFDADDARFFALQPPRETRLLLIDDGTESSLYLRAALEAAGDEGATKIPLDTRRELPGTAADLASYSLVVLTLHGAARAQEMNVLAEYARAGGNVWVLAARDLDAESWNALARSEAGRALPFESLTRLSGAILSFSAMDTDAPQLRALDENSQAALRAARVNAGFAVSQRESASTLMRWNDGSAAFVSEPIGEGTIMLLATSPERASGNLGASPSFPSLVSSILRSTTSAREPLSQTIGEPVRLSIAPDADVKITSMDGRARATKARELVSHPLRYFGEPGIYRLEFAGAEKFLAFNSPGVESERALATVSDLKSFFSVATAEGRRAASANSQREAAERNGAAWEYFLIAAFLLIVAELLVAMRQRRISRIGDES